MVIAHAYDPETFAYVGEVPATESPYEPGTFHATGNSTLVKPANDSLTGETLYWNGAFWYSKIAPVIYHYHPDSGEYLSQDTADASPLDRPGTWLYPAHCTKVEPPAEQQGFWRRWDGNQWQQVAIPEPQSEPEPEPQPEPPNWDGFSLWALSNAEVLAAYEQAPTPVQMALFTAYGGRNLGLFSSLFNTVCTAGDVALALREAWAEIAANTHRLPPDWVSAIAGS